MAAANVIVCPPRNTQSMSGHEQGERIVAHGEGADVARLPGPLFAGALLRQRESEPLSDGTVRCRSRYSVAMLTVSRTRRQRTIIA